MKGLKRRDFLAGLGVGGALLPLLDLNRSSAQGPESPKRFIAMVVPNGYTRDFWPSGGETDFVISDAEDSVLKPLIPYRDRILIMGGIDNQNGRDSVQEAWGGHASMPFLLTGARGRPGPRISDGIRMSSGHMSIDHYLAEHMPGAADRPFKTLPIRALRRGGNDQFVSFYGPCLDGMTPNAPPLRDDPRALYLDLFGEGVDNPGQREALERLRAERRSIFDVTSRQLTALAGRVSSSDRHRIEAHQDAVRAVERQLDALDTAVCGSPPEPTNGVDYREAENLPLIVKTEIDLLVAAMQCDLTRAATLQISNSVNNHVIFPFLVDRDRGFVDNIGSGDSNPGPGGIRHHHAIAHSEYNSAAHTRRKNFLDQWFMEQFAYLIDRLANTAEAIGGSMLDNTVARDGQSPGSAGAACDLRPRVGARRQCEQLLPDRSLSTSRGRRRERRAHQSGPHQHSQRDGFGR